MDFHLSFNDSHLLGSLLDVVEFDKTCLLTYCISLDLSRRSLITRTTGLLARQPESVLC